MNHLPIIGMLLLAAVATACQREQAPAPDQDPAPAPAPVASAPSAPPPMAEGADMTYACQGSELRVVYAQGEVRVSLADGRQFVLPRSAQQGKPGEEFYAGEGKVLRRYGNVVELRQQSGEPLECLESSGTA